MKKLLLMFALAVAGAQGRLCAQSSVNFMFPEEHKQFYLSATEKRFNSLSYNDIRDFVYLKNGKLILEVRDVNDYKSLAGLDTILQNLQNDIAFYHDSLENGVGNVRIDYGVGVARSYREIRFIKYTPRGEQFVVRDGKAARLKIEQDTIRITVQDVPYKETRLKKKVVSGPKDTAFVNHLKWIYPVQITLVLNNYTDLPKVIGERDVILQALDTLASVRTKNEQDAAYKYPSSCIYWPYNTEQEHQKLTKFPVALEQEHGQLSYSGPRYQKFVFYGNISAGLVRNGLVPGADAGITYINHDRRGRKGSYSYSGLYVSSLFFFDHNADGKYYVHDNWLVNIEQGTTYANEILGLKLHSFSIGAGYVFLKKGDVFTGTTVKLFAGARLMSGLTLYPEVIATNNFKQVFPGVTLKIFGFNTGS